MAEAISHEDASQNGVISLSKLALLTWPWAPASHCTKQLCCTDVHPDVLRVEAAPDLAHPEVLPLLRGAWLGKPSAARTGKTRFFQLSADGTTLRWGWKKHVLLFHVDEMVCNDDDMSIRLVMTVDRDLHIKFPDRRTCEPCLCFALLSFVTVYYLTGSLHAS